MPHIRWKRRQTLQPHRHPGYLHSHRPENADRTADEEADESRVCVEYFTECQAVTIGRDDRELTHAPGFVRHRMPNLNPLVYKLVVQFRCIGNVQISEPGMVLATSFSAIHAWHFSQFTSMAFRLGPAVGRDDETTGSKSTRKPRGAERTAAGDVQSHPLLDLQSRALQVLSKLALRKNMQKHARQSSVSIDPISEFPGRVAK